MSADAGEERDVLRLAENLRAEFGRTMAMYSMHVWVDVARAALKKQDADDAALPAASPGERSTPPLASGRDLFREGVEAAAEIADRWPDDLLAIEIAQCIRALSRK